MDSIDEVKKFFELTQIEEERLKIFVRLLIDWQKTKNLVSSASLKFVWNRHVADSMQAHFALPSASRWIDFGSGAGFPGIVTAIMIASRKDAQVHLIESNNRKAAFLSTVVRETGIPADIKCDRVESVSHKWSQPIDAISARAFAPLERLCKYAEKFVSTGATGVFHKGKENLSEIETASQKWSLNVVKVDSQVHKNGCVLVISRIEARK